MDGVVRPLVSIVIPLYNQSQFVSGAIHSALNQTFKDLEVIVVDDGSTDSGCEVVASFGEKIKYIYQKNQGLAAARNTGIREAQGDFIGLLDADDQWLPNYLETMISLANQHPEASVYYCCAQSMDLSGKNQPQLFGGPALSPDQIYPQLLRANFLIPSTILMRRAAVVAAGLFDQSLRSCEDWDLWLRMLPQHQFYGTSKCLVKYRLHGNSLSTHTSFMQNAIQTVIEKNFGPDDGQPQYWSQEKRRAYGGVYRYRTLTSVNRLNDWNSAASFLTKAFQTDPTLSSDLNFFYDLAHGTQPLGYRNTRYQLDLERNAESILQILFQVFNSANLSELNKIRNQAFGTAYYAFGLIANITEQFHLCRCYLLKAIGNQPSLTRDIRLLRIFTKSMLGNTILRWKTYFGN
jgi:glycosyltransferase involved in cell wall biosynthesis